MPPRSPKSVGGKNPWIIDVSSDVYNFTCDNFSKVVNQKAKYRASSSRYVAIGSCFGDPSQIKFEQLDLPSSHPISSTINIMLQSGIKVFYGKWLLVPGHPVTILFDISSSLKTIHKQCQLFVESIPTSTHLSTTMIPWLTMAFFSASR